MTQETQEQHAVRFSVSLTRSLQQHDGGQRDYGLYLMAKALGLYLEQFPDTTPDDVICASGVSLCTVLRTYEAAYAKRHASDDKTAISVDATGRMPLLTDEPVPITYNSYLWNNQRWEPITVTAWQPLVPGPTA